MRVRRAGSVTPVVSPYSAPLSAARSCLGSERVADRPGPAVGGHPAVDGISAPVMNEVSALIRRRRAARPRRRCRCARGVSRRRRCRARRRGRGGVAPSTASSRASAAPRPLAGPGDDDELAERAVVDVVALDHAEDLVTGTEGGDLRPRILDRPGQVPTLDGREAVLVQRSEGVGAVGDVDGVDRSRPDPDADVPRPRPGSGTGTSGRPGSSPKPVSA